MKNYSQDTLGAPNPPVAGFPAPLSSSFAAGVLTNDAGLLANAPNPPVAGAVPKLLCPNAGFPLAAGCPNPDCPNADCPNAGLPNDD